jgi:mono/diheme cytochrome c family protein/glucose/arabinose dehydrogenase
MGLLRHPRFCLAALFAVALLGVSMADRPWPPGVQPVPEESPVLAPEEALKTFYMPPGFRLELVASEPLVEDPVAIDFDPDGRLWVVEMRGFMPDVEGRGERAPVGRVVVLEDEDGDGRMDRKTVYMDGLVLPRALKVLDQGVLVAAPPYLWLTRDTTGNLKADTKEVVRDDYGDPKINPEHNANGLLWGLDNWIYNANYGARLRLRQGRWEHQPTVRLGQWGVSMDDVGRLYRNYNEDPLRVDLVPEHYFARNPNVTRRRGIYEQTVGNEHVWPVRPTPGVNRGYREEVLRDDGTLARFTSAGSPVVYRGDRLPADLRNDVFVTEPAGNLVHRFRIRVNDEGLVQARNAYERGEFLASTDERFRPVNLYSAPDGTLYVVDMYRGIIQHGHYLTDYLKHHIRQRNLAEPLGLGRIYRVVHASKDPDRAPRLSTAKSSDLVDLLSHPNGWRRDTAQRLLVERGEGTVVEALRNLARSAPQERTRLHALWTLDGLEAVDAQTMRLALVDPNPHVRATVIRIAERSLDQELWRRPVMSLMADGHPVVRRQLAASLGELSGVDRLDALAAVLSRHAGDPIVVDLVISGLHGLEPVFLERLLTEESLPREDAVAGLAAAIVRSGHQSDVERLLDRIGESDRRRWQRLALLAGIDGVARRGGGERRGPIVTLQQRPEGLLAAMRSTDQDIRARAERVAESIEWPGKPAAGRIEARTLSEAEQRLFETGRSSFDTFCAPCHQLDGSGLDGAVPPLVGSSWVVGRPDPLIRIVLHGKEGTTFMPPLGMLDDEEIAAILTYVRRAWRHQAPPVAPDLVREVRGYTTGRDRPWTDEELLKLRQ